MLHIILVEASLETVPPELLHHPSVRRNAKRRGKRPEQTLLNRSLHHSAMGGLHEGYKRGRPDITHICLLEALSAPLNRQGGLRVWVHTLEGFVIEVSPEVRLPRDCNRFNSLMEQLFAEKKIPPGGGSPLLTLSQMGLAKLIEGIKATRTVALTSHGKSSSLEDVCGALSAEEAPVVLIGAFPHGAMTETTLSQADDIVSIYPEPLEAWVVISRLIHEFEKTLCR